MIVYGRKITVYDYKQCTGWISLGQFSIVWRLYYISLSYFHFPDHLFAAFVTEQPAWQAEKKVRSPAHTGLYVTPEQSHSLLHQEAKLSLDELTKNKS